MNEQLKTWVLTLVINWFTQLIESRSIKTEITTQAEQKQTNYLLMMY